MDDPIYERNDYVEQ